MSVLIQFTLYKFVWIILLLLKLQNSHFNHLDSH